MTPFKSHFINDLSPLRKAPSASTMLAMPAIGLKQVSVERCEDPFPISTIGSVSTLCSLNAIRLPASAHFLATSFATQLKIPGIVCFRAFTDRANCRNDSCGMCRIAWPTTTSAHTQIEGYRLRASFALFRQALDYFAETGLQYANLGAGAGLGSCRNDGLSRFKRGWSTAVRNSLSLRAHF